MKFLTSWGVKTKLEAFCVLCSLSLWCLVRREELTLSLRMILWQFYGLFVGFLCIFRGWLSPVWYLTALLFCNVWGFTSGLCWRFQPIPMYLRCDSNKGVSFKLARLFAKQNQLLFYFEKYKLVETMESSDFVSYVTDLIKSSLKLVYSQDSREILI